MPQLDIEGDVLTRRRYVVGGSVMLFSVVGSACEVWYCDIHGDTKALA